MSAHTPLNGVLERHELPVRTSVLLNNEGLRQISTALVAIKTCSDLLAHRENEMGEGLPTFCGQTVHGLLAAVACCTTVIENQINAVDTEGALLFGGGDVGARAGAGCGEVHGLGSFGSYKESTVCGFNRSRWAGC